MLVAIAVHNLPRLRRASICIHTRQSLRFEAHSIAPFCSNGTSKEELAPSTLAVTIIQKHRRQGGRLDRITRYIPESEI
jgi:hypothetical protein